MDADAWLALLAAEERRGRTGLAATVGESRSRRAAIMVGGAVLVTVVLVVLMVLASLVLG